MNLKTPTDKKKKLVLFDFDGTITTKDTFPLFFKFAFGELRFYSGFSRHLIRFALFKLKLYDGSKLKRSILSHYLKGKKKDEMEALGIDFVNFLHKESIIKGNFIEKINKYKSAGYEVAIVSASPDVWIKPFSESLQIAGHCTELEYSEGVFTGNLRNKNCNYIEKKHRVLKHFKLEEFEEIIVYGDSSGDKEMMDLATQKNWV